MARLHVPTRVRWSDLDGYRHVNNASMLRLLEEARIDAFWSSDETLDRSTSAAVLDGSPGADTMTLIARQELEYLVPIPYLRAPLDVQIWIGRLGGASLEVCYEVWSPIGVEPAQLFTKAATTIVLVETATDRPRRISQRERSAWEPYVDEPLTFRRR
ncbi:acyl-CoA thioesterase [Frigoribacterium faeni]|uniref:Acyl-CoA thioester hydrolase n=1 Tax=Frigoribacterium faeni TaxID=145483 RepID=A0A7W3JI90_9MICO|nr:thioesterase family protein [Frigoribacterium faeni]MBA8813362.1 acyl-CoA thioester hydrolase [Frigoribacterium faeni]BFF14590.1 thioesterase family protein [Microbacterium flavescens]GEK83122.1 thioesterase [Frigoribacterium faeni]